MKKIFKSSHRRSPGGDYLSFKNGGTSAMINTGRPELRAVLDSPDRFFEEALIIKDSRSVTVARIETPETGTFLLKRYKYKGLFYSLTHIFKRPRPAQVLIFSNLLRSAGVKTPKVLATIIKRRYHLLQYKSYLLTEYVENIIPPDILVPKLLENKLNFTEYRNKVIFCLNHLHENCAIHGDLKIHNIYCKTTTTGLEVGLLDLDSVECFKGPINAKIRAKDLSRFIASIIQIAEHNNTTAPDVGKICEFVLSEYERVSGFSLDYEYIRQRVNYHIERKRGKRNA